MNGRNARKIRKKVYGEDGSPRARQYKYTAGVVTRQFIDRDDKGRKLKNDKGKVIIKKSRRRYHILSAGPLRQKYQFRKRMAMF